MYKICFDIQNGMVAINGVVLEKNIYNPRVGKYPLLYIPNNENYRPIITQIEIRESYICESIHYNTVRISDNLVYLFFEEIKKNSIPQPEAYFQQCIDKKNKHYITAYKASGNYYLTIETENEIYNLDTENKLENIEIIDSSVSSGELITIKADCDNKQFVNIVHYNEDYESLLKCICNKISGKNDELIITDQMNDSIGRIVNRHFVFKDGEYIEISRDFEYLNDYNYVDGILPYVFMEGVFAKDFEFCKKILAPNLQNLEILQHIGEFTKIINIENFEHPIGQIYLLCKQKSQNTIKCFDFKIQNNVIVGINELEQH